MKHPAKYSAKILPVIDEMLGDAHYVLDPFAGTGRIHELPTVRHTVGIEIEKEWADMHPSTMHGDATFMPQFRAGIFDAIATSPAYGNRMADSYDGRDGSKRNTYRTALGRELDPGSGAGLQWGEDYRTLHANAWAEATRVLKPGGRFVLNLKDHIRGGEHQHVVAWHIGHLVKKLGYKLVDMKPVLLSGNGFGLNGKVRVQFEIVALLRKR
jgi:tRNA G10  N-methylase Trm11